MERVGTDDVHTLRRFLRAADLTVGGLDPSTADLWVTRDERGAIIASTGYELSRDTRHALLRSVAVSPAHRSSGLGTRLARFTLRQAADDGAQSAWLFSRRSGPFWQRLGFAPANRDELVESLGTTHQVQLFTQTGQLQVEQAWQRPLSTDI